MALTRPLATLSIALLPILAPAQTPVPIKTALCEIAKRPETFDGKLLRVHGMVDTGVDDLPSGLSDESCGAALKFFTPDDQSFARLVRTKGFRNLTKDVKRNPLVEATVTGWFKRIGTEQKPENGLALESVEEVVVKRMPHLPK